MLFIVRENALEVVSERLKIQNFPGGPCPHTPAWQVHVLREVLSTIGTNIPGL